MNYSEKYSELYEEELRLEKAYKTEAAQFLRASIDKAIAEGKASQTKVGSKLIDYSFETVKDNIMTIIQLAVKPKKGVVAAYMPLIKELTALYPVETLAEILTLESLSVLISGVLSRKNTLSQMAGILGKELEMEKQVEDYFQWKKANAPKEKGAYTLYCFNEGLKVRIGKSYKIQYARAFMREDGFMPVKWNQEARQKLGAKLIEMCVKGTGYFEEYIKDNGMVALKANTWLEKTWLENTALLEKYAHKFCPTVIPPLPWTAPEQGGYYGELALHTPFVRLKRQQINDSIFLKSYLDKLHSVDLSFIYEAVNALQNTPFTINKEVLQVIGQIWESGGGLGLPPTEPIPMLPHLPEPYTQEELKVHKKKQVGIIKANQARVSRALRAQISIATAKRFSVYDKIYFPWNIDYRGRCYPIPTSLSPQGDDITKALLLFAEPTKCKNADDWKWLAIHGANLAGHDKVSFTERIAWIEEHSTDIIASAIDPLGYKWWYDVSKNDYPLEFIAFCIEWKKFKEYFDNKGSCIGFASGIPIAFDGTCSGLQHFSAALRDEVGGYAVNLVPTDKVQDIYSLVADKVNKVLLSDSVSGTPDDYKYDKAGKLVLDNDEKPIIMLGTKTLAQQWLNFARLKFNSEGITRKVVKRSVMTLAYGSKKYGFKENIQEDIIKPFCRDYPSVTPFIAPHQAAMYMATLTWNAVATTVVKAVEGMEWLQKIAANICKAKAVVTWTTPNGLPVQQNYFKKEQHIYKMRFNGAIKRFYYQEVSGDIDNIAQRNAISPNFIHSMDACHMQRVIVAAKRQGNTNFAMVHDSFGTDMAKAGELYKTIRNEFIGLYADKNVFQDFLDDVSYLLADNTDIPPIPQFGKLDLDAVIYSDFCFA